AARARGHHDSPALGDLEHPQRLPRGYAGERDTCCLFDGYRTRPQGYSRRRYQQTLAVPSRTRVPPEVGPNRVADLEPSDVAADHADGAGGLAPRDIGHQRCRAGTPAPGADLPVT